MAKVATRGQQVPVRGHWPQAWRKSPGSLGISTSRNRAKSRKKAAGLKVTTSRERWSAAKTGEWLLWEAFVPGDRKPASDAAKQHIADARAGVQAFSKGQVINGSDATGDAVNLLALLADWAGLSMSVDERHQPLPIYGPPKAIKKA